MAKLEAARAEWKAAHVPLADLLGMFGAVLQIVSEEAGPATAGRVAGRVIVQKLQKVERLQRGQR